MSSRPATSRMRSALRVALSTVALPNTVVSISTRSSPRVSAKKIAAVSAIPGSVSIMTRFIAPLRSVRHARPLADHSRGPQALDLLGRVAELAEDLVVVLPEPGWIVADGGRRVDELDRRADRFDLPLWMIEFDDHPVVLHLRVLERLLDRVDRAAQEVDLFERFQPLGRGLL